MNVNLLLKDIAITDEKLRWIEIYKITNISNLKMYIGQAVSHVKRRNKFIPHGMNGRFRTHVYQALGNNITKYRCRNLNNAIKKYGVENFTVQLVRNCNVEDANRIETEEIVNHNSLSPNGYNLTTSCKSFLSTFQPQSVEHSRRLSNGVMKACIDKRFDRILAFKINITESYDSYIRPKYSNKIQIGWYIRLRDIIITDTHIRSNNGIEFTSQQLSLEEDKIRALDFIKVLHEKSISNMTKLRGTPLQPSLPLILGNINEELG
jgi:hypothetical protein